ncbi:twin-arginine translocation signal domain-containing protein [Flavihumibacter profundi]|uniref:twin-arginine translocation signal domain-containing protein n=1 Tax=Flavihumibacter profundi TaxID=2716883 RepID=UPI001CC52FFD|nr:twin-arginine translocation signal domain-containing protein [Flavihumibacter profundi]MBZ5856855.1 twin-arginine translocation signal domain-containing protein [Flavihumibacter profundi]
MERKTTRRRFIQLAATAGAGLGLSSPLPAMYSGGLFTLNSMGGTSNNPANEGFIPNRAASWWCDIQDIQWPQKAIRDKIKRRAENFAKAQIDTAINFGFHNRFDFAPYFKQLHGYYNNVCEELHKQNIRFMDHYSCNHITRPRNEADFRFVNKYERLGVLLIPEPEAAKYAQYEGHRYQDLCEVDLRDGSRGYASQYQYEAFCHNNPGLHDMHGKYLKRLMKEVPFDGIEVDDMCSYPGNTTCSCIYCRDRFRRDYGHEIPAFPDKNFFGDTTRENQLLWGNYTNPVYRDWLRMKSDSIRDHVKLIKSILGDKPLMTCCSNTGPIVLNAVALDLEKMAPYLDIFMLENVGTNIRNVNWVDMEGEAMHQKDIAAKRGNAPAIALSYALSEKGAYLGWGLGRFWGVANWSSTLNGRLEEDPANAYEMEDVITKPNNWEKKYSDYYYRDGQDLVEIRLVNNYFCRENGWRDAAGYEHWDRSQAWATQLVKYNVGYRFVRSEELADADALSKEKTPVVLDGVGCVSDQQFNALQTYLSKGGTAWIALPFGTHDHKGNLRKTPLSNLLQQKKYARLNFIESALNGNPLEKEILSGKFEPVLKQVKGDTRWAARFRFYKGQPVIHFMNAALTATPADIQDLSGIPLIKDIDSGITDNSLAYELDTRRIQLPDMILMSPEQDAQKTKVLAKKITITKSVIHLNLGGLKIYAVLQPAT